MFPRYSLQDVVRETAMKIVYITCSPFSSRICCSRVRTNFRSFTGHAETKNNSDDANNQGSSFSKNGMDAVYRVVCKIPLQEETQEGGKTRRQYAFLMSTIPYFGNADNLEEGQFAIYHRSFTNHSVQLYSELIGDYNPVHSPSFDVVSNNNKDDTLCMVQGIYATSIFSSIFGTLIPGSIYRSQTLTFLRPIYTHQSAIGRVDVTDIKQVKRKGVLVTCNTVVYSTTPNISRDSNAEAKLHQQIREGLHIKGTAELWIPSNA